MLGIITIDDRYNFGNRLQNLALQTLMEDMGYQVYTFHRNYSGAFYKIRKWKFCIRLLIGKYAFLSRLSVFFSWKRYCYQRFYRFYLFNKNYLRWDGNVLEDVYHTTYLEERYDALVAGSDQVWNFQFRSNKEENLFAGKKNSDIKKISFAASVGNTWLTEEAKKLFQKYLNNFDAVSVREKSAVSLLQPYYRGEIILLRDPTLLVGREYWEKITQDSKLWIEKKYILLFFLGSVSEKISVFCKEMEKRYQIQTIELNDIKNPYCAIGPIDFLKIIRDADYILTDSFHCSVFSILFQKKFCIYNRNTNSMDASARTDDLLELFGINHAKNIYSVDELDRQVPPDGEFIDRILEPERKKAEEFLRASLGE